MSGSIVRALVTEESRLADLRQRGADAAADGRLRLAEPLVSFVAPASLEAEQYRALRHLVERLHRDNGLQVFAVTSAGAGEGKTITTLNLAGSLAQAPEARVLVIDADLHRPTVAKYLGLGRPRSPGLAEAVLHGSHTLSGTVRRIEPLNVSVLLAGTGSAGSYELLTSPRLEELLTEARGTYDYVLIDTPPVVPLADSRLLSKVIDGYVVVVAAHKTPRKLLADACDLLDTAKLVAVVFNGDDQPLSNYYGYYGTHEGSTRQSGRVSWWRRVLAINRHP
jgi:capsular exopolysaccharide synthesis family protein